MPEARDRSGGTVKSSKKCPVCDVDLVMSERQGIEVDFCPQCRGVWLDRGELDKIIKHSLQLQGTIPQDIGGEERQYGGYRDDDDGYREDDAYREDRGRREESGSREDNSSRVGNYGSSGHGGGHASSHGGSRHGGGHGGSGHGGGHGGSRYGGGHGGHRGRSWLQDLFH